MSAGIGAAAVAAVAALLGVGVWQLERLGRHRHRRAAAPASAAAAHGGEPPRRVPGRPPLRIRRPGGRPCWCSALLAVRVGWSCGSPRARGGSSTSRCSSRGRPFASVCASRSGFGSGLPGTSTPRSALVRSHRRFPPEPATPSPPPPGCAPPPDFSGSPRVRTSTLPLPGRLDGDAAAHRGCLRLGRGRRRRPRTRLSPRKSSPTRR
jgi:hypothetical protein